VVTNETANSTIILALALNTGLPSFWLNLMRSTLVELNLDAA
jgi:hypothetical protein